MNLLKTWTEDFQGGSMQQFAIVLSLSLFLSLPSLAASQQQQFQIPANTQVVQLSLSPGMAASLDLALAIDTSTTPMKLKGKYQSFNANGDAKKRCQFSSQLTRAESENIQKQLKALRYCQTQGEDDMVIDPEYLESLMVYTQKSTATRDARGAEIRKYVLLGWGPQKYLCKGGKEFYRLMKSISEKRTPQSCPSQSARLFDYRPAQNQ